MVNDHNQHALWPTFAPVPDGWHEAHPAAPRDVCLDHIERTWTDLAPGGPARPTERDPKQSVMPPADLDRRGPPWMVALILFGLVDLTSAPLIYRFDP